METDLKNNEKLSISSFILQRDDEILYWKEDYPSGAILNCITQKYHSAMQADGIYIAIPDNKLKLWPRQAVQKVYIVLGGGGALSTRKEQKRGRIREYEWVFNRRGGRDWLLQRQGRKNLRKKEEGRECKSVKTKKGPEAALPAFFLSFQQRNTSFLVLRGSSQELIFFRTFCLYADD